MGSSGEKLAEGDIRFALEAVTAALKSLQTCPAKVKAPGGPVYEEFNEAGWKLINLRSSLLQALDEIEEARSGGQ